MDRSLVIEQTVASLMHARTSFARITGEIIGFFMTALPVVYVSIIVFRLYF